jgi:ubiquitin carboxyl-terminal hydrolase 8
MDFSKYKDKGLTGLANLGNTCYLNSCIQILSHVYELDDALTKINFEEKLNPVSDSILLVEWHKLYSLMWSENCTIAPHGFLRSIQKIAQVKHMEIFSGYAQNDLPEFLIFLVDAFHTSLMRKVDININGTPKNKTDKLATLCYKMIKDMYSKNYSEILDLFYGISVTQIVSLNGEVMSMNAEPFCILSLSIPNIRSPSIFDCLDLHCENELMENDNAWFNEKTNEKESINKNTIFWSLPKILIIDIKRFNNNNRKIHKIISTPFTNVDFTGYIRGYHKETFIYELFGVCNHSGGCQGGHYTAYVKNANNKWYEFNDTNVREINEDKVVGDKSYCFFYRKIK